METQAIVALSIFGFAVWSIAIGWIAFATGRSFERNKIKKERSKKK